MPTDPRRRQKKLERRSARRKKKRQLQVRAEQAGEGGLLALATRYPPLHSWIAEDVWDQGIGQVLLSRALPDGRVAIAVFLVDAYCLGVKDAFGRILNRSEYNHSIQHEMRDHCRARDYSPEAVRKFVEGAVTYAAELGIQPHADYATAKILFGDIDASKATEEFEYGKDGKPFFIAGPHDTPQRCEHIIQTLLRHCGEGNFDFLIEAPPGMMIEEYEEYDEFDEDEGFDEDER
jgi:hypothetical protein